MKVIVGIGNPGKEYQGTRHNVGFEVADLLKNLKAAKVLKPRTYVNRTGDAVAGALKKFKAGDSDVLIVCDDVNLVFGKMRLRAGGSAGGHKGLQSVIEALGSEDFPRLRIGVKNEKMPKDLAGFVLEKFSQNEQKQLGKILDKAVSICESWVSQGFEAALNQLSRLQSNIEN